jgi:hypothetical protein
MDELDGTDNSDKYTAKDKEKFNKYIEGRIDKTAQGGFIHDRAFLRERIMTMYANPLRNKLAANNAGNGIV